MPWNMPDVASVQIGQMKAFMREQGWVAHARHYYKDIVSYVGIETTLEILNHAVGEHLFAAVHFSERRKLFANIVAERMGADFDFDRCVAQLDRFLDDAVSGLETIDFGLVGFTTTHVQLMSSICMAARLKKARPGLKTVFGGLSLYGEQARELVRLFDAVDYVVVGEGEVPLVRLLEAVAGQRPLSEVPSLVYGDAGQVLESTQVQRACLDELPRPDYSDFLAHGDGANSVVPYMQVCVEAGRGCKWGKCSFCIEGLSSRQGYRSKSAERVRDEILAQMQQWRTLDIIFTDPDMAERGDVFGLLAETGVSMKLTAEVSGHVSRETLRKMRDAGLEVVQIGIESFSPNLLKKFKKGVRLIKYVELMKWCDELGMRLVYNVIVGAPFETQEDVDVAVDHMQQLYNFAPPLVSHFVVSVGSEILSDPAKYNIARVIPSPELSSYPEEVAKGVGALLSFHAGYGFEPIEARVVNYERFDKTLAQWHSLAKRGFRMRGRIGIGFLDIEMQIGQDEAEHVVIVHPVERAVYALCAPCARSLTVLNKLLVGVPSARIERAILKLSRAKLMFAEGAQCLSLATFKPHELQRYLALLVKEGLVDPSVLDTGQEGAQALAQRESPRRVGLSVVGD
jgi:ribosomal peptide maturation radical SAM protein 1